MHFPVLNLPSFPYKCKQVEGKWYILDMLRRRYVRLTPEEWVRQHFVMYLIQQKKFPSSLIMTEYTFVMNGQVRRCDIAVFDSSGGILAVVECKSPAQRLDQNVFDQIFVYNMHLQAPYLMLTNGLQHFCCKFDLSGREEPVFLDDFPFYTDIR